MDNLYNMILKYISFVICFGTLSYGADILAVVPMPSYSHQIAYTNLWKELSLRGHKVTLITTDPLNDPTLTNLTEIGLHWAYKYFEIVGSVVEEPPSMWQTYDSIMTLSKYMSEEQLSYPPVQDLIHSNKKFDVVLVEFFFVEFFGFAEIYNCPKILISSFDVNAYYHHAMGNPAHPILHPDLLTPFFGALDFKERVTATLFSWYLSYFFPYKMIPAKEVLLRKHFNTERTLEEIISDVDMLFINENPVLKEAKALGPTTINVGGFRKPIASKPPSKDLEEYLNNATEGFIYFSLGTNVKSKDLKKETLTTMIETLKEIPYKILWKFEADELPGKPENVKLVKWAPQQYILSHPNIVLFITQGGLQSMEESIHSEVASVVMPFFGDQDKNAKLMASKGISIIVKREPNLKKEEFKSAILEVINNPRYKNSVKRLKALVLDAPMSGLETAIWWTEYVIRNKGAKHLRNPAADLPFYQYYLLDVIGFLISAAVLVAATVIIVLRKIYKLIFYKFIHKSVPEIKKIQ